MNVAVKGENRGLKPFAHQRKLSDPWFWLRDDDRKVKGISVFVVKNFFIQDIHAVCS